jgi:hypothetical protein
MNKLKIGLVIAAICTCNKVNSASHRARPDLPLGNDGPLVNRSKLTQISIREGKSIMEKRRRSLPPYKSV